MGHEGNGMAAEEMSVRMREVIDPAQLAEARVRRARFE